MRAALYYAVDLITPPEIEQFYPEVQAQETIH